MDDEAQKEAQLALEAPEQDEVDNFFGAPTGEDEGFSFAVEE